jgi:hypothetical protein
MSPETNPYKASLQDPPPRTWVHVAEDFGITYRRIDYWLRKGYIKGKGKGSGYLREVDENEEMILHLMIRLTDAGLVVEAAAIAARRMIYDGLNTTTLPGGVILTLEEEN